MFPTSFLPRPPDLGRWMEVPRGLPFPTPLQGLDAHFGFLCVVNDAEMSIFVHKAFSAFRVISDSLERASWDEGANLSKAPGTFCKELS